MRKHSRNTRRTAWVLMVAIAMVLISIPTANLHAKYPFLDVWSEAYGGNWTASTQLEITADSIMHHAWISSSIDTDGHQTTYDDPTSYYLSEVPIDIDCADPSENVYTDTNHWAYYSSVASWEVSSDLQVCYNVN